MLQLPLNVQLDDSARFDNYYSASNEQLVNRLQSFYQSKDDFIFLWGAAETGKTHLAQALCHSLNQNDYAAVYLPLEMPELTANVLEGMGNMDIVCLDNIELVLGNSKWETALFDLYNHLKLGNKGLVITCNDAPANLTIKLKDLQSRLTSMEIYKLISLNDDQKVEFFVRRSANRGLTVTSDVASFILSRYSRSVSDLISILERLDHSSMILKRKVTIPLVKQILDSALK